jgi:hypothetical protein
MAVLKFVTFYGCKVSARTELVSPQRWGEEISVPQTA